MSTDTTRWRRVRELIEAAMELAGEARAGFLETACAGDSALRGEVEALLAQDALIGGLEPSPSLPAPEPSTPPDRRIGAYALVREIGSGGMGTVYLAERADGEFHQRVAIKVMKRGMDTEDILRRFKLERQLLAGLEHPNIARLYDGGATDDGLPYLALEFVDGIAIDRWCDEHRSTVRQRIELFLMVCSAVHHAHQNLVVHRDLKPSNILVSSAGVPKLLDFGIAKVLIPEGAERTIERTSTERRILTPAYASPEQRRGAPITTASDVFSLGVVLHELLIGRKPFLEGPRDAAPLGGPPIAKPSTILRAAAAAEEAGAARRVDGPALRRMLSGDLDTIVLKALQEDPARRYPSVDQLAADLRRYLDGSPVLARPDSLGYRASKFIRRNKILAGAAVVLFLALAGGFTTSTFLYLESARAEEALKAKTLLAESRRQDAELAQAEETVQRELAEQRFNDVRKLATTFIFDVHAAIEPLHGSLPARQLIVKTATDYLERLAREKRDDAGLQLQLANSWLRIGEIQCSRAEASFGNTEAAMKSYEQALAIAEDLVAADPRDNARGLLLIQAQVRVVELLMSSKRLPEARVLCERALASYEALVAAHPADLSIQREGIRDHTRLAEILRAQGDHDGSLAHYRAAAEHAESLAREWAGFDAIQVSAAEAIERLGEILDEDRRFDDALAEADRAFAILGRVIERNPDLPNWRREMAVCRNVRAKIDSHMDCLEEALVESRASLDTFLALARGDELNYSAQVDAGASLTQYASVLFVGGLGAEAEPVLQRSVDRLTDLTRRVPDNLEVRRNLAVAEGLLALCLVHRGDDAGAVRVYGECRSQLEEISGAQPSDRAVQVDLYQTAGAFGRAWLLESEARGVEPDRRRRCLAAAEASLHAAVDGLRGLELENRSTPTAQSFRLLYEGDLARCGQLASAREAAPASADPR